MLDRSTSGSRRFPRVGEAVHLPGVQDAESPAVVVRPGKTLLQFFEAVLEVLIGVEREDHPDESGASLRHLTDRFLRRGEDHALSSGLVHAWRSRA